MFIDRFGIYRHFEDIIQVSIEEESLLELLNLFFPYLSARLYQANLNERNYSNYISVFQFLVSIKPVAAIFQIKGFQPPDKTKAL